MIVICSVKKNNVQNITSSSGRYKNLIKLVRRYFWDKKYQPDKPGSGNDEEEIKKITKGKYIPPRRVVHLGQFYAALWE